MATIDPKFGFATAGITGQSSDTINAPKELIFTGDNPPVVAMAYPVGSAQNLVALEVVALVGGYLVPAVETTAPAFGIMVTDADNSAGADGDINAEVYRWGMFNPNVLTWDASYSTDELKRLAFEGAASPTNIFIRKPVALTV